MASTPSLVSLMRKRLSERIDSGHDLDLLIGTCRDEIKLFVAMFPTMSGTSFDKRAHRIMVEFLDITL